MLNISSPVGKFVTVKKGFLFNGRRPEGQHSTGLLNQQGPSPSASMEQLQDRTCVAIAVREAQVGTGSSLRALCAARWVRQPPGTHGVDWGTGAGSMQKQYEHAGHVHCQTCLHDPHRNPVSAPARGLASAAREQSAKRPLSCPGFVETCSKCRQRLTRLCRVLQSCQVEQEWRRLLRL